MCCVVDGAKGKVNDERKRDGKKFFFPSFLFAFFFLLDSLFRKVGVSSLSPD
jgi:hypothetical protein